MTEPSSQAAENAHNADDLAAAVDAALTPTSCPMDEEPKLAYCPHYACWIALTCQCAVPPGLSTTPDEGVSP